MDYLIFAATAVLACAALSAWLARRDRVGRWAFGFWGLVAAVLVVGHFLVERAGERERGHVQGMLEGFAPTYAGELARLGHAGLDTAAAASDPRYLDLLDAERRWLALNPAVADIYTCRRDAADQVVFVVDSETDYDRDGRIAGHREGRTAPGEVWRNPPPEIAVAFAGRHAFTAAVYHDRWGSWVSAFEPLRGPDGSIEAVLGVDYSAAVWLDSIDGARRGTMVLVALALLAMAFFHTALTFQRVDLQQRREVTAALEDARAALETEVTARTAELRRLATVVEQAAEAVVITDLAGDITYVNPAFERLFGFPAAAALGRNPRILKSGAHPDEVFRDLWATIMAGRSWAGRLTNRRSDGGLVVVAATISPIRDGSGAVVGFASLQREITEQVQREEQLRASQRLESIGLLAGGVAHDFNNLLTAITGHVELLLRGGAADCPGRRSLEEIRAAAGQASRLTAQLLAFSRRQMLQPRVVDLDTVVAGMEPLLRRLIGEDVELVVAPGAGGGRVEADPSQLEQVVMNLAVNARDAMPEGGTLTITTGCVEPGESGPGHPEAPAGHLVLAVGDTGVGMAPEVAAHVFEPFFTTKELGRGTGLGLATVHGIVTQSGGLVTVQSAPGQGSTFRVLLPRTLREVDPEPERPEPPRTGPVAETVLLVEDNEMVRELLATVLAEAGYRVLRAAHAAQARSVATGHGGDIDLLVTDLVMPGGVGGRELAAGLVAERASLKVLLISGYSEDAARGGPEPQAAAFLQKPFSISTLLTTVRAVLDTPA